MDFEELDYPEFREVLQDISTSVVEAQKKLDDSFREAVRQGVGGSTTRYVIPRMELEYRTIFSVRQGTTKSKKKLVVVGPKKIKEDKLEVEALSRVRIEMVAVPPEATSEAATPDQDSGED